MADTTGWTFVDDRDPGIVFSLAPGDALVYEGMAQEYDQTTTGLNAGDTATYYFNASSIGVFGTYDITGDSGPPISVYQVDDTAATTVTAPVTQTTLYRQNFWTSPQLASLAPGAFHTLVITATAPNDTLWLDYLAYLPDNPTASTTDSGSLLDTTSFAPIDVAPTVSASNTIPSSSTTDAGFPTASASVSNTIPLSSATDAGFPTASASGTTTFSPTLTTTAEAQLAPGASNTKNDTDAIAASIAVGAVAFVLAIAALLYIRSRRGSLMQVGETDPSPYMFENSPVLLIQAERPPSEGAPPYPSLDLQQEDSPQCQPPRHVPVRSFDGGVRLMGGPLEIPPVYQEHYQSRSG